MMMSFEFFDPQGHLSPRKILFTEKTCPNKTQRVLSNLFGAIMKWNARRWAENFLENSKRDQSGTHEKINEQISSLLKDIRKNGFVSMTQLLSVAASGSTDTISSGEYGPDQQQNRHRYPSPSRPFLLNHEEIIHQIQRQDDTYKKENLVTVSATIIDGTSDQSSLREACSIIATHWNNLSQIHDGQYAPAQFNLPALSGFLDYCCGRKVVVTVEQMLSNEAFIGMKEADWSKYKNIFTPTQFSAWTRKRDEWIDYCKAQDIGDLPRTENKKKPDLRRELAAEVSVARDENEPTIYQAFSQYAVNFNQLGHGTVPLPKPVDDIFDSGFLLYCEKGPSVLQEIEIDNLEKFLTEYKEKWDIFEKMLTPNQFAQLIKHRDAIDQDIATFRKNNPSSLGESLSEVNQENDSSNIEENESIPDSVNRPGLFCDDATIGPEHLNNINWDAADLPEKITLNDVDKLVDYFSSAALNKENLRICKKIHDLAKDMQDPYTANQETFKQENAQSKDEMIDALSELYGRYLKRFAAANADKKTSSITKKSKKSTRKEKK